MIVYKTRETPIVKAITAINRLIESGVLIEIIAEYDYFDMATLTPTEISVLFRRVLAENNIEVKKYKPFYRWSKAIAKYMPSDELSIYLNQRRLSSNYKSIAGTIAHELTHLVDELSPGKFNHAGNSSKGKGNTAPYSIGSAVKAYL